MKLPQDGALAYSVDQAAHLCGLSSKSIQRAIKSGELRAKRTNRSAHGEPPSGRILILRSDLETWLENLDDDWWGLRY
ncbi:hypothetical protein GCM10023340_36340 [Nocardioides marinquilinus]|uniref:Helix-turn-helix domain-containing protein n=1 Tax=Nocardioides marinquilinus TaxID=1210400 RepID=A0ABP9PYK5_9ACTN